MSQSKSGVLVSTDNSGEYTDQNGGSRDCTPKEDPLLKAEGIIDNQEETRTVVNEIHNKEEALEETARNSSNQKLSTQSKSKKKKTKKSSKGITGNAETIEKCAEEIKVGKEGMSSLQGILSDKYILDIIKLPSCMRRTFLPYKYSFFPKI